MVPVCWQVLGAAGEIVPAAAETVAISKRSATRVAMAAIAPVRGWRDIIGPRSVLPAPQESTPASHQSIVDKLLICLILGALPESSVRYFPSSVKSLAADRNS